MLLDILRRLDLPRASDLPKPLLYQLIIAYILISLPMIQLFPIWIPALATLTLALKVAAIRFHFVVSKWVSLAMLVVFGTLILMNTRLLGKEYTGIALLFVFASLKILEAREQRDAFLLMLIYLLLIMGALMAQHSPFAFLYLVGCFLYNIYIQLRIAQPPELGLSIAHNLKSVAKLLIVSIPFVAVLFFLFPRFGPLWKAPGPPEARTGLSDEMTSDSVSKLVQDGGLAFRVKFDEDEIPDNDHLYWRGPVLTNFDGKTWRRSYQRLPQTSISVVPDSKISYTIYHDGRTKDWIVPLDMLGEYVAGTTVSHNYEMKSRDGISTPKAFSLVSYTQYQTAELSDAAKRENLLLPHELFPKTRALAQQIHQQSRTPTGFADKLWQYFHNEAFYYDLAPPVGNADLDTFLFDNRVGYCQHFSAAFVFMLRSQGVPARVVTGYQGGELNRVSGEFEVRQLHAHAWAEVYLPDKGWVRYDPTAAVSPERVNLGTPFGSARSTSSISVGARWENQSAFIKRLTASFRAANAFWQNWIINYDSNKQNSIWKRLGLGAFKYVAWLLLLIVLSPIVLLIWWWYRRRQAARYGDDIYRTIQPFFRYLEKADLRPAESQALQHWLTQQNHALGNSKQYAENVVQQYYRLRYSGASHTDVAALDKAITLFIDKHRQQQRQQTANEGASSCPPS